MSFDGTMERRWGEPTFHMTTSCDVEAQEGISVSIQTTQTAALRDIASLPFECQLLLLRPQERRQSVS